MAVTKTIFKTKSVYTIGGKLWIECNGKKFFGPGPVELLVGIAETGSINKAAAAMKMSYKKAWEMINALNASVSMPLVITHAGGEKGGGSVVTEQAKKLIDHHRQMRKRFAAFLENETKLMNTTV